MNSKTKEVRKAVEAVVAREGAECEFDMTSKGHLRVEVVVGERRGRYVLPSTPGCSRSVKNNCLGVRRLIRSLRDS